MGYDSITNDLLPHKKHVEEVMEIVIADLQQRAQNHDNSKKENPELDCYNEFIPKLQKTKYGTDEYREVKEQMGEGLKHHFQSNRHHPEHFKNGIEDMTLIDVVEMFCDWKAASKRSDTDLLKGLKVNQENFGFSDELLKIFINTEKYLSEGVSFEDFNFVQK